MKRIIISGSTGYIGSNLIPVLSELGYQLAVVVRDTSVEKLNQDEPDGSTVILYRGCNSDLAAKVADFQPDVFLHLAGYVKNTHGTSDIQELIRSNIEFGTCIADSALRAGCRKIINTGTYAQFFSDEDPTAVSLYAATKDAFGQILDHFSATYDASIFDLILHHVYGNRDPHQNRLISFLVGALNSQDAIKMTLGEQKLDFVHVSDVVRAYVQALELISSKKTSTIPFRARYNVGTKNLVSLRELVTVMEHISGMKIPVEWGAVEYRSRQIFTPWEGSTLPGWRASISLNRGISEELKLLGII